MFCVVCTLIQKVFFAGQKNATRVEMEKKSNIKVNRKQPKLQWAAKVTETRLQTNAYRYLPLIFLQPFCSDTPSQCSVGRGLCSLHNLVSRTHDYRILLLSVSTLLYLIVC